MDIKGLMKKVKLPEAIQNVRPAATEDGMNLKSLKKSLEEKMNEKAKIFGFIGMEVYDLSKEEKIEIEQIKSYLEKMDAINAEIEELEAKKEELEKKNVGKHVCSCGYKLKPNDRFCPNCGEVVEKDTVLCSCGTELSREAKFCATCGRRVEDIIKEQEVVKMAPAMKECICGAKIPVGQFMCLECGRKIEE